ncbi:MAG: hydrogenase 4 membrane subunit [Campylobacteraceae bacterium]
MGIIILDFLSICIIATSLLVFAARKYKIAIKIYIVQTILLVLIFLFLWAEFDATELKTWAMIAFFTKVVFVSFILFRLVNKLGVVYEDEPVAGFFISPIIAIAFSLAIAMSLHKIFLDFSLIQERTPVIAAITIFMIGIFGFILRNSIVKQILAYCTLENGIHLSLALMAYNSPKIAEIGILTDAIFAVLIMSVLAQRFYKYYGTLDTSKANNLKG